MDVRLTQTDSDEDGDYVVPNVLSPRALVSKRDGMDESSIIDCRGHLQKRHVIINVFFNIRKQWCG